ncbi:ankyrin repeat domain-containing protein [Paenibacillus mendelii]|uniref:Ankyrin repeat domain-containing protein n=1 Tax=Paenibacillus mendelii TaxID=206163 RepID=A0ABV6J9Q8_9BACL|nr:ankyrin repeat domain-containing protein [Paenibacillus mendelii]MCQ6563768.1 ankyrin repeat domain-containing protein [Paenibacillus mendelii]
MSEEEVLYRTGTFAELAGVTTRALRHYERLGLLTPRHRSESGQRFYTNDDFIRLQQIVTLKFVGFSLKQIHRIIDRKDIHISDLLSMQREWIERKIGSLQLAVLAIRETERAVEEGIGNSLETLQQIIGVMEMQINRNWLDELLEAVIEGNEATAKTILTANPGLANTSIHAAAALGDANALQRMIESNPDSATERGGPIKAEPLLYLAFSCFLRDSAQTANFVETALLLLESGANPNAYTIDPDDPYERKLPVLFGVLGQAGNVEVGKIFLEAGADPNDGETLYHTAELPRIDCLDLLNIYGVDVNATPAMFRKLDYDDEAGVRWFLEHGADLSLTLGKEQNTPLHWAVYRGRSLSIIELLLKHGTEINARRTDGKTPYMLAVRFGQTDVADLLIRHGATIDTRQTDLFIGACAAADAGRVHAMLSENPSLLSSLTDEDHEMLLELAERGQADAVGLMLEVGFDKEVSRANGTALHIASWFGHLTTVRVLLDRGASLSVKNAYGGTPLESALHGSVHCNVSHAKHHGAVVEALIQAGAALPSKASGNHEVFEILRKHGASV